MVKERACKYDRSYSWKKNNNNVLHFWYGYRKEGFFFKYLMGLSYKITALNIKCLLFTFEILIFCQNHEKKSLDTLKSILKFCNKKKVKLDTLDTWKSILELCN